MKPMEAILSPVARTVGGVQLPHFKQTAELETAVMPPPEKVTLAMLQHIGAPCEPLVKVGDVVFVGTKIADSPQRVCAPIHSSVSGTVTGFREVLLPSGQTTNAIEIASDGLMTPDPDLHPIQVETEDELVAAARECGLVGLGGAGFPTHIKLSRAPDVKLDTLIINAAECEPYITADYRECLEHPDDIREGVYLLKQLMGFERVILGIEDNKPKAFDVLKSIATDERDRKNEVHLMRLPSHYPQGAEKVILYAATGRKLPLGRLPADVGCIVMNVTTLSVFARYLRTGMPLVSKRLTVAGPGVGVARNCMVPLGASAQDVLAFCGGLRSKATEVFWGGPMMGLDIADLSAPVLKQNNAIVALTGGWPEPSPCIRCGRCSAACPMKLMPAAIETAMKRPDAEKLRQLHADYCIECGCCSYICPAKRPLTQTVRLAKSHLRRSQNA